MSHTTRRDADPIADLVAQLQQESDERERLRIGGRLARLDADHPALESFGEQRLLLWCDVRPVSADRLRAGLTATDPRVRRVVAETLLDAHLEPAAVTACLLREMRQTTGVAQLYDDRHHEIHDAAWGRQFDFLRSQWPWFVRGLLHLDVACPATWLDDPNVSIQLNACRLLAPDDRIVPILRRCLERYSWLDASFWTFIAACELPGHHPGLAWHLRPELEQVRADAPPDSLPRLLAGAVLDRSGVPRTGPDG